MTTKGNVAHWRGLLTSFVIMVPLLSSSVAGEPTSLPTEWICMYSPANAGSSLAIRRESPTGNIQCLAPDGRNCRWKTGAATSLAVCNAQLAGDVAATSNYLTCGPDHKAKYNSTGYEGSRSWCWEGSNIIPLSMPSPYICTQFKDLPSPNWAPVHRDAWRDVECLTANDGMNCLWSATKEDCEAKYAANKDSKIQLSCGIDMKAKFDYTGYDKGPLHFCFIGNITLPDYHPVPNPSS